MLQAGSLRNQLYLGRRYRENTADISELEAGPRGLRPEDIKFVRAY